MPNKDKLIVHIMTYAGRQHLLEIRLELWDKLTSEARVVDDTVRGEEVDPKVYGYLFSTEASLSEDSILIEREPWMPRIEPDHHIVFSSSPIAGCERRQWTVNATAIHSGHKSRVTPFYSVVEAAAFVVEHRPQSDWKNVTITSRLDITK